ncbi:MAG: HAMP domain-containing histidine kinase, partial [Archangiaceae bacterium]|nr:HAMP domain-containing histidine kinase [Archangiaceae bacterium]
LRDTGAGIPADVKARIFEPFFTTKPDGKGTGLGLSIVQGIIENHGGRITVESDPGKGSAFRIVLPMVRTS